MRKTNNILNTNPYSLKHVNMDSIRGQEETAHEVGDRHTTPYDTHRDSFVIHRSFW